MPTRVIDLGCSPDKCDPYVFATGGTSGRYVALSYCWGDRVKPKIRLKTASYSEMIKRIEVQDMTKTHQEAIQISRELGYQYLWIDAICIIQDSTEDWQTESLKMTDVYGNADLTLVAGRAGDSTKGFIANHFQPAIAPHRLEYTNPAAPEEGSSACFVTLPRSLEKGPVEARAWCFQEAILSRRSVVYGVQQLCFGCQEGTCFEDGTNIIKPANREGRYILSNFSCEGKDLQAARETMLRRWYWLVDQYSIRNIFDPHDIFAALMGLAKAVQKTLGCRYLAGLWEDDMIRGLLWSSRNDVLPFAPGGKYSALQRPVERNTKKPDVLGQAAVRAPSWSWASVEGPVLTNSVLREEKYMRRYRTPSNFCIRPALQHPPRWTSQDNCGVDQVWMPACELELLGSPRRICCSERAVVEYAKRTKWWYSPARIAKHGVLLVAEEGGPEHVVGVGIFDVPQERTRSLWALQVIKEEGLMLLRDGMGKFRRLGVFVVEDEGWFQGGSEIGLRLV